MAKTDKDDPLIDYNEEQQAHYFQRSILQLRSHLMDFHLEGSDPLPQNQHQTHSASGLACTRNNCI